MNLNLLSMSVFVIGHPGQGAMLSLTERNEDMLGESMPPLRKVNFCNFCGQQANFRCMRCKKTFYCSVVCQSEDWRAHRHICKASTPAPAKETPVEAIVSPVVGDRTSQPEPKMNQGDASTPQRVYLRDLEMTTLAKGTEIQATVLELHSPSKFFLLAQSPEVLDALHQITTELQKTYSGCSSVTAYTPNLGEVCAVQFSHDLNWYRGLVQSMAADQKTASILYIDFGNEEDVPLNRIQPLATNIKRAPPCALRCCVARVVPPSDTWTGECCIVLRQAVTGKNLTVSVVGLLESDHVHAVDILLPFMGKQLSTFLIECGYALEEETNVKPTKQEINALENASLENFKRLSNGKDDNTWAQPPEPLTQALGDSFSVVVTHLQSPLDIICQKVENASVIQELQLKLREHCLQLPASQNFRPAPGTACCAQFSEDNQWYRAKVLAYSSEERVCVGYIDFGNSEEVDLACLRPLSTSLLALPMQAIPCALAGVQPVGESWSEACVLAMQSIVSNRILCVKIMGGREDKALVSLIDEASDPQANVAEVLISAGYAAPSTSCNQPAEQAMTAAGDAQASGQAEEPLVWSCAELPTDGQTVALLVSVVENPEEFYCRIHNPKDHEMLIELGAQLKQHCKADAPPFSPKAGEPCCAMFSGDGAWYRVMVKEVFEEHASVYYVDYGNNSWVLKSDLRAITPRLLKLPFQAVRCWLAGVLPRGLEWSKEALLWFQTLVDGRQLSARVLSVTDRGYGVELESNGQSVAATLISEQQGRSSTQAVQLSVPTPRETHATTGTLAKNPESMIEKEQSHSQVQASNVTGASTKDAPAEEPAVAAPSAASFPVDWKTVELPLNQTFEPCVAAVISPSLFYILSPSQVDVKKLQQLMMELATYCNSNQASYSSSAVQNKPAPAAACCTQFSADNNWYRAVVLEAEENEVSVIYADYGNTEKVPYSRIMPIPLHLLELPFQITRCALSGKEHFPAVWPVEVVELFKSLLSEGVLATVQSFDGSTNLLSVTLSTERGRGQLNAMILDGLQAQTRHLPSPTPTLKADHPNNSTSSTTPVAAPDQPQPASVTETYKGLESTTFTTSSPAMALGPTQTPQQKDKVEDAVQKVIEQMEPPCGAPSCKVNTKTTASGPATSGCCCLELKTKIDHLEQLMQQQLSLIKQMARQ
ncbi:tudor domain-containing protein 1 isoform X3 [Myripristis murdjan]|uniref:tudor domain-containing protein 1 isoform X3 n=1 Tax=Myripristis murdjan TaxID=586833 RepID=UPI001176294E|nr:tudor domain-containing protein 1 isoform X3 [Myripristis murdjan]